MTRPLIATDSTRERRPRGLDVRRLALPQVDDAHDVDAGRLQVGRGREPAVVGRQHDRALRGLDRPEVDEPPHAVGKHHADEVVAGKDERLLHDAGRDHDPARLGSSRACRRTRPARSRTRRAPIATAGARSSTPASTAPWRSSAALALPARSARSAPPTAGPSSTRITRFPASRRPDRRLEPRLAAADHDDVGVLVDDLDALATRTVRVELPEAGGAAEDLLVERPELPRPDERLVVEARRRERPAELVGDPHQVAVERAHEVLSGHDGALADRASRRRGRWAARRRSSGSSRSGRSSTGGRAGGGT